MPHDKLIQPPTAAGDLAPSVGEAASLSQLPYGDEMYQSWEPAAERIDLRRYLFAIFRYKWLLALAVVVGIAGALLALRFVPVIYAAQGSLWIEVEDPRGSSDVQPIRPRGLLEASAWIQLMRSFQVLEPVVVEEHLYVEAPVEFTEPFESLRLAERIRPGDYELSIGEDGSSVTLTLRNGRVVQRGTLGEPLGIDVGMVWTPSPGAFPPGASIPFTLYTPREAALRLSEELGTSMTGEGSFLQVTLSGPDPRKVASVLNALMERHVAIAADLKRAKLDETLAILEEQLRYTDAELADAEQELEEFRVVTVTLPSDLSTPIAPGLGITRGPVFSQFFELQLRVEEIRRDRLRLESFIDSLPESGIRIEALEVIPAASASSELRGILAELVEVRAELRALRNRYSDDYPLVQEALVRIGTLENEAIPELLDGILGQLAVQERQTQALVDSASVELTAIPPRTIEEGRLRRRVQITENLYNELRSRVETARLAAASSIPDVTILDPATVPRRPAVDQRLLFAAAILFGCLGLAVGGAILLDRVDSRFRYAADVSKNIGLNILGSIPRIKSGRNGQPPQNAAQALEAFRELRIHTGFAFGAAGPLTLTVTSPSEGEGKSLIASNLAVSFAEVGRRTLLIDADTRRGDAHRLVGRQRTPGLIDYLRQGNGQDVIQRTDHQHLDFIGSGARSATTPELLASGRMAEFVGKLKRSYEVIIVDSPPLASGGDSVILATLTGNLAIVIRTGSTEKQMALAKLDQLSRLPIRVLGVILNDVDPNDRYHYYYTSYLPGYEPGVEETEEGVRLISGRDGQAS